VFIYCRNKYKIKIVVCFLLGNYSASEFYMPTFRNTLELLFVRFWITFPEAKWMGPEVNHSHAVSNLWMCVSGCPLLTLICLYVMDRNKFIFYFFKMLAYTASVEWMCGCQTIYFHERCFNCILCNLTQLRQQGHKMILLWNKFLFFLYTPLVAGFYLWS